jgi:hypothetical protein
MAQQVSMNVPVVTQLAQDFGTYGQFFDKYGYHWIFKGDRRKEVIGEKYVYGINKKHTVIKRKRWRKIVTKAEKIIHDHD